MVLAQATGVPAAIRLRPKARFEDEPGGLSIDASQPPMPDPPATTEAPAQRPTTMLHAAVPGAAPPRPATGLPAEPRAAEAARPVAGGEREVLHERVEVVERREHSIERQERVVERHDRLLQIERVEQISSGPPSASAAHPVLPAPLSPAAAAPVDAIEGRRARPRQELPQAIHPIQATVTSASVQPPIAVAAHREPANVPPEITVSIGRLDIRLTAADAPIRAPRRPAAEVDNSLPLNDYLDRRDRTAR
jgi:hypothetical protein